MGCTHREFENIRLPSQARPCAFAFEAKKSAAAQHRTQDWWEHDEAHQAWIRHHVQPRKRLYQPGDEGGEFTCLNSSRITFFDKRVALKGCPSITDGNNQGGYDVCTMIGKHLAIKQMNFGPEKQFSVMDRTDQTSSSSLQWQAKPDQDLIATNVKQRRKQNPLSSGGRPCREVKSWRHGQAREPCEVYDMSNFLRVLCRKLLQPCKSEPVLERGANTIYRCWQQGQRSVKMKSLASSNQLQAKP